MQFTPPPKTYSITRDFGESTSHWQSRAERTLAGQKTQLSVKKKKEKKKMARRDDVCLGPLQLYSCGEAGWLAGWLAWT